MSQQWVLNPDFLVLDFNYHSKSICFFSVHCFVLWLECMLSWRHAHFAIFKGVHGLWHFPSSPTAAIYIWATFLLQFFKFLTCPWRKLLGALIAVPAAGKSPFQLWYSSDCFFAAHGAQVVQLART